MVLFDSAGPPVGPSVLNKGAVTRLNNDRSRAAKMALGSNLSASESVKLKRSGTKKAKQTQAPVQALPLPNPGPPQAPAGNTGNMQMPPQLLVDPVAEAQAQFDIHEFLNSPEFGDTVTKNTLVNYYKGRPYDPQLVATQTLQSLAGVDNGREV